MICEFYDGFYRGSGGIETHIRDLVAHLPWEFEIVADGLPGVPRSELIPPRTRVTRFAPRNTVLAAERHLLNRKAFFPYRAATDLIRLLAKRHYLRDGHYQLVHVHGFGISSSLARLLHLTRSQRFARTVTDWSEIREPRVLTVHGLWSLASRDAYAEYIERSFISQFDRIICVDEAVRSRVLEYLGGPSRSVRTFLVRNGVDPERFSFRAVAVHDPLRVGFAGRLERSRGVEILISLINRTDPHTEFLVAGLGNAGDLERFQAATRGARVRLLPNLPWEAMPQFLQGIDVLVNPVAVPGISRVTLESMAVGRPVVMSRMGDRYPVVDRVTGLLVDHDEDGYRQALELLRSNPEMVRHCGERGAEVVRAEFSVQRMCEAVRAIYEEAMEAT